MLQIHNLHYEKFQDGTVKCIEDEIPFEVPEGWSWCRLHSLSIKIGAGSTPTGGAAVYATSGIKFIRSQNVYDDGLILDNVAYISEEINQKKSGSIVKPKDILLNITGGSIGRCALVSDDFDIANVNQHVMIIRLANLELRKYIHSVVISPYIQEQIISRQVGSGRGGLSAETLSTFLIPLPPLNEQVSIIEKLNECICQVSVIADEQCNISNLIIATKSKILDLAIRGKLVPQDPNDEPASILLERIRTEKEELIKQGIIKRDKKESIIFKGDDNSYYENINENTICINDDLPYELPCGWSWCKLMSISAPCDNSFVDGPFGSNLKTEHYTENREVRIIQLNNIGEFVWRNNGIKYTTFEHAETLKRCVSYPEDIVIAKMMPAGRTIIIPHLEKKYVISSDCVRLRLAKQIDNKYVMYMLNSPTINSIISGDVHGIGRSRTSLSKLKEIIIPLPPISEQNKIVQVIETVFTHFDAILSSIS